MIHVMCGPADEQVQGFQGTPGCSSIAPREGAADMLHEAAHSLDSLPIRVCWRHARHAGIRSLLGGIADRDAPSPQFMFMKESPAMSVLLGLCVYVTCSSRPSS